MEHKLVNQIFPRLYEIYTLSDQQNPENCLCEFSVLTSDSDGNSLYEYYEKLFQRIDRDNWEVFKKKISEKVIGIHTMSKISITGKKNKERYLYMENFKDLIILMGCMVIFTSKRRSVAKK